MKPSLAWQVEDLHRIVTRQTTLMRCCGVPKEEAPPAQQAQRIKKADVSGDGRADPRTVLVSNLGNGSGGSQPSTDQGSWTQVLTTSSLAIACLHELFDLG